MSRCSASAIPAGGVRRGRTPGRCARTDDSGHQVVGPKSDGRHLHRVTTSRPMRASLIALLAGIGAAVLVAGFPAAAADQSISAVSYTNWNPSSVTVDPGNTVTWSNDTAYSHNICVAKPGDTPQGLATD